MKRYEFTEGAGTQPKRGEYCGFYDRSGQRHAWLCCPDCGGLGALDHTIDKYGNLDPSLVCARDCGFPRSSRPGRLEAVSLPPGPGWKVGRCCDCGRINRHLRLCLSCLNWSCSGCQDEIEDWVCMSCHGFESIWAGQENE